ncbi:hypothetical protein Cgig2_018455 [Carnegiea gigantea]|uniref:Uncharacterized protein n=1 Tax=Carnegiea gigantea TaxID=171969 RepID=A0A9Q1K835_9CARY|nr:hypothetical protein Cgig2_018455 [Carnegiea gigantea]
MTRKCARLDCILCNMSWRTLSQEVAMQHLLRRHSDHLVLLIQTRRFTTILEETKPFRFRMAWNSHAGIDQVVHEHWNPKTPLMPALHTLVADLNKWNREIFGNLFRRKKGYVHVFEVLNQIYGSGCKNLGWRQSVMEIEMLDTFTVAYADTIHNRCNIIIRDVNN